MSHVVNKVILHNGTVYQVSETEYRQILQVFSDTGKVEIPQKILKDQWSIDFNLDAARAREDATLLLNNLRGLES